jgi:hypothetical protein
MPSRPLIGPGAFRWEAIRPLGSVLFAGTLGAVATDLDRAQDPTSPGCVLSEGKKKKHRKNRKMPLGVRPATGQFLRQVRTGALRGWELALRLQRWERPQR